MSRKNKDTQWKEAWNFIQKQNHQASEVKAFEEQLKKHPELARKRNEEGQSLLMIAAYMGHADLVQALIPYSLVNAQDGQAGHGWSALMHAVNTGQIECVKRLMPYSKVHLRSLAHGPEGTMTALDLAREKGFEAIANVLAEPLKKKVALKV